MDIHAALSVKGRPRVSELVGIMLSFLGQIKNEAGIDCVLLLRLEKNKKMAFTVPEQAYNKHPSGRHWNNYAHSRLFIVHLMLGTQAFFALHHLLWNTAGINPMTNTL